MSYKLKHTNSTFPFKASPLQQSDYVGTSTGIEDGRYVMSGDKPPIEQPKVSRFQRFMRWKPKILGVPVKKRWPLIAGLTAAYAAYRKYRSSKEAQTINPENVNNTFDHYWDDTPQKEKD